MKLSIPFQGCLIVILTLVSLPLFASEPELPNADDQPEVTLRQKFIQAIYEGKLDDVRSLIESEPELLTMERPSALGCAFLMDENTEPPVAANRLVPLAMTSSGFYPAFPGNMANPMSSNMIPSASTRPRSGRINPELITFLIEQGAVLNIKDAIGRTPLHYAVLMQNRELAKLLLEKDVLIDANDSQGNTPLLLACMPYTGGSSLEMVKLLIQQGANINATNHQGQTPLTISGIHPDPDVAAHLLENGAVRGTLHPAFYALSHQAIPHETLKFFLDNQDKVPLPENFPTYEQLYYLRDTKAVFCSSNMVLIPTQSGQMVLHSSTSFSEAKDWILPRSRFLSNTGRIFTGSESRTMIQHYTSLQDSILPRSIPR